MKIRMLTSAAGYDVEGRMWSYPVDEVVDAPSERAKDLLKAGSAEPVAAKPVDRAETRMTRKAAA